MITYKKKIRADKLLVERGLIENNSQARAFIMAGRVRLSNKLIDKPGRYLDINSPIQIISTPKYVSRGGNKLEAALKYFQIKLNEKAHALDIGASTGGFTDCLLQFGVKSVTCIDVGRGQLHNKLLKDSRVINFEKLNARMISNFNLPFLQYNIIVVDVSFISLTKILSIIWDRVEKKGILIALIKPQFEAKKYEVDQGKGIIKDSKIQKRVIEIIKDFVNQKLRRSYVIGILESPIKGSKGNSEFFIAITTKKFYLIK